MSKHKVSSGDLGRTLNRYNTPQHWFWLNNGLTYTPKALKRFWHIVAEAQKELDKKNK